MESGFFDIILFAMIAGFLVLRLRSVLGRRTGHERQRPDPYAAPERGDNVLEFPERGPRDDEDGAEGAAAQTPVAAGLTRIRIADPSFAPEEFLAGARAAFEMIVGAYAAGDDEALRPLLDDQVYANFKRAMDARRAAHEEVQTDIEAIKSVDIVDAGVDGTVAFVTIKVVSDQVNAVRNAAGEVVEGNPDYINTVVDVWTFARDTRSDDPNWLLVETRTPEDEDGEDGGDGDAGDGNSGGGDSGNRTSGE